MTKIVKVENGSDQWNLLKKYWTAKRVRLDVDGVIGESSGYKTRDYIWLFGEKYAVNAAKEVFETEKYFLKMPHDYIPGKSVYVWKGCPYVKMMISGGVLWIDIHA